MELICNYHDGTGLLSFYYIRRFYDYSNEAILKLKGRAGEPGRYWNFFHPNKHNILMDICALNEKN